MFVGKFDEYFAANLDSWFCIDCNVTETDANDDFRLEVTEQNTEWISGCVKFRISDELIIFSSIRCVEVG